MEVTRDIRYWLRVGAVLPAAVIAVVLASLLAEIAINVMANTSEGFITINDRSIQGHFLQTTSVGAGCKEMIVRTCALCAGTVIAGYVAPDKKYAAALLWCLVIAALNVIAPVVLDSVSFGGWWSAAGVALGMIWGLRIVRSWKRE